jgi:hypothetical protein
MKHPFLMIVLDVSVFMVLFVISAEVQIWMQWQQGAKGVLCLMPPFLYLVYRRDGHHFSVSEWIVIVAIGIAALFIVLDKFQLRLDNYLTVFVISVPLWVVIGILEARRHRKTNSDKRQ